MLPNVNFIKTVLNGLMQRFKVVDEKIDRVDRDIRTTIDNSESRANKYADTAIETAIQPLATQNDVNRSLSQKQNNLSGARNQFVGFSVDGARSQSQDLNFCINSPDGTAWRFEVSNDGVLSMVKQSSLVEFIEGCEVYSNQLITSIGENAFRGQNKLTQVDLPNVTSLQTWAFEGCTLLTDVSFKQLRYPSGECHFGRCTSLTHIDFPVLASITRFMFQDCVSLADVVFPEAKFIDMFGFENCTSLTKADFPECSTILKGAFNDCTALESFIIRFRDHPCVLEEDATKIFRNTPITNGTGYVYVRRNLIDQYKRAEYWSSIVDQIRAIEDYPSIVG